MTQSSSIIAPPPRPPDTADVRARWGVPRGGDCANAGMLWVGMRVLWLAYFLVWLGAIYFFVCVPKARRASMSYLDRLYAAGHTRHRGRLRRAWQTYRHMVEFGFLLLDRALML